VTANIEGVSPNEEDEEHKLIGK
jgi:hypothetical protein